MSSLFSLLCLWLISDALQPVLGETLGPYPKPYPGRFAGEPMHPVLQMLARLHCRNSNHVFAIPQITQAVHFEVGR